MTQAERIRNMTDEELAYFLAEIDAEDEDEMIIDGEQFFSEDEILKWLKSDI